VWTAAGEAVKRAKTAFQDLLGLSAIGAPSREGNSRKSFTMFESIFQKVIVELGHDLFDVLQGSISSLMLQRLTIQILRKEAVLVFDLAYDPVDVLLYEATR